MSSRDRILAAVRRQAEAQPDRSAQAVEARLSAERAHGLTPVISRLEGAARYDRFRTEAEKVHATLSEIADLADLPGAIAHELRQRNLGPALRMGEDPAFQRLDWDGIEVSTGPGRLTEPATLSRAFCAVAETGTLMLLSGPENPVTLTFLGETHFITVAKSEIEAGLEAAWTRLRAAGADSRTVNFVTGPSRTGDIEQKLELGAHGPVALHIFVVDA